MFSSSHKAFLMIITAYITFDCAHTHNPAAPFITSCLNEIATYFKITLTTEITEENYVDSSDQLTKLICAKHAITNLKKSDERATLAQKFHARFDGSDVRLFNLNKIKSPSSFCRNNSLCDFCAFINPFIQSDCKRALVIFGKNKYEAFDHALNNFVLSEFEDQPYVTAYMMQISKDIEINHSDYLTDPLTYCISSVHRD